jgi:hypothetical protein
MKPTPTLNVNKAGSRKMPQQGTDDVRPGNIHPAEIVDPLAGLEDQAIAIAVKAERERCAKIADSEPLPGPMSTVVYEVVNRLINKSPDPLMAVSDLINSAVNVTKQNIAKRIRNT